MTIKTRKGYVVMNTTTWDFLTYKKVLSMMVGKIKRNRKTMIKTIAEHFKETDETIIRDVVHDLFTSDHSIFIGKEWNNAKSIAEILKWLIDNHT